jgi:hypothetical protein
MPFLQQLWVAAMLSPSMSGLQNDHRGRFVKVRLALVI